MTATRTRLRTWLAVLTLTALLAPGFTRAAPVESIVLVLGDSLSAGHGLPTGAGWVDLLARKMAQDAPGFKVVNASISGETTFGGVSRLPILLETHRPAVVVVELGANDGLRGTDLALTRSNLDRIVARSVAAGARVLVIGMRIPPNYGPRYTQDFFSLFGETAHRHGASLVPFLLDGLADRREWFQEDGLHPVAAAQPRILDTVWPALAPLLKTRPSRTGRRTPAG